MKQAILIISLVVAVGFVALAVAGSAIDAKLTPAERAAKERADHSAWLAQNPDRATDDEVHNIRQFGHYWNQTDQEKEADGAWDDVKAAQEDWPTVGSDYRPFNAKLTTAYRRWEGLEAAAYGKDWKGLWQSRNEGDPLGECAEMGNLGGPVINCTRALAERGKVEPLEDMLWKCRSGEGVSPMSQQSCDAQRVRKEFARADGPADKVDAKNSAEAPSQ